MNYWLHRVSLHGEVSYPLLEKNILSIGFADFVDQVFIDKILNNSDPEYKRWEFFGRKFDEKWGIRPRTRYNLWRFIESFKQGDTIVVPHWQYFSVYTLVSEQPQLISNIESDNLMDCDNPVISKKGLLDSEQNVIDLGFFWEVKPIAKDILRKYFADSSLTARMKIRTANADITDLKDSVETAIESFKNNKPINLYPEIIEKIVPDVLKLIEDKLNPAKFEKLVKYYFEKNGATKVDIPPKNVTGKAGDADVIAVFESIKTIIYAQVKFHNSESETNEWAVQQITAYQKSNETMVDDYSTAAWVITSAKSFTNECTVLAQKEKIHLIDGDRFTEMLIASGIDSELLRLNLS